MDSCVECTEPSPCACLALFIDCFIVPDPRPWVEFQTTVLVNELQEISRNISASSNRPWVHFQTTALMKELHEISRSIRISSSRPLIEPPNGG